MIYVKPEHIIQRIMIIKKNTNFMRDLSYDKSWKDNQPEQVF